MRARVTVFQERAGKGRRGGGWRWHFAVNGRIMADSGEAYTRRRQAWRAWDHFREYIFGGATTRYAEYTTNPKHSPTNPRSAELGRGHD